MLNKFTSQFTEQPLANAVKIGKRYYQVSPELDAVRKQIDKSLNREAQHVGIFLGEDKGNKFVPSLPLLDLLGQATHKWIMVDDNAEWLFICGRDVFSKSVVKANVNKGLVLVVSKKQEVLGYGKIEGKLEEGDKIFLKNFLDKGDFLRRDMGNKGRKNNS
ncbi:MAG: hypothetical protein V1729_02030 [Candidatus Woesearchaeota archaeon]